MRKSFKTFFVSPTHILLILIILLAAFMRLYRIGDYLTFLGDEGRDVLVVKHILEGHLTFLGPRASAADFYTGPIYYYMMAPFLFLSHLDPVGPAIMIALLGIATVYLIYRFGKEWFGVPAALTAASLYAVSPLVISYSRSSWNPNPMPFFSMIIFYLLYKAVQKPSIVKFLGVGILYGVALQLHYIEIIVGTIILAFVFLGNLLVNKKVHIVDMIKQYAAIGTGFIIGESPFLLFELRHNYPNIRTIINFLLHGNPSAPNISHNSFLMTIWDVFFRLFGRLLYRYQPPVQLTVLNHTIAIVWQTVIFLTALACIIALYKVKNSVVRLLFGLWLFLGVIMFGLYHQAIYDYYFEFMFPLPFLLFGNFIAQLKNLRKSTGLSIVLTFVVVSVFIFNLLGNPFRDPPNRQKQQVQEIAEFVLSKTDNKPFNFALLTKGNSDQGYRYFFELEHKAAVPLLPDFTDPKRMSVTDQLLIVCEDPNCQPLGSSEFEVAGFGRAEIDHTWKESFVKVYRLHHFIGKE